MRGLTTALSRFIWNYLKPHCGRIALFWQDIIYAVLAVLSNIRLTVAAGTVVLTGFAALCSIFSDLVDIDNADALPYRKAIDITLISPVCHCAAGPANELCSLIQRYPAAKWIVECLVVIFHRSSFKFSPVVCY